MLFRLAVAIACLACVAHGFIAAHTSLSVRVLAHKDECFYEDVKLSSTKVFFHFAVTNGGALDIDASVFGPDNQLIWSADKEMEARVLFKAKIPGPHRFCFSNKMSTVTLKTVTFAIQVGDTSDNDGEKIDPIQRSLSRISEGLTEIKNEQTFLRVRDRLHRETAESTNTRVIVWSVFEMVVIAALAGGQIFYLVSRFEKRRIV